LYGGLGGDDPQFGGLITLDPATGAGTFVGSTGYDALSGLSFVPAGDHADRAGFYRLHLGAGQALPPAAGPAPAPAGPGLRAALGTVLAQGSAGAGNVQTALRDFVAPSAGDYFVRVFAPAPTDYTLVVTRGATFETEPNNDAATARDISITGQVAGALGR